ncbi:hypothetical protein WMF45_46865 [Sorangium sp. So ce448]|uniref:DUF7452 domain-containing protein n=1 Tax=Sorangium sp. So ce448 TaxID=3133314 RepID=UPI003F5FA3A4
MNPKTISSRRRRAAWLLAGSLLAACSGSDTLESPLGVGQSALAPDPTPPGGEDAGDAAWVEQVVPALLGRPVRSFGELKFLTVMTARVGRARLAEALMNEPAFVDRWTGVLLDRLRVDREGNHSQEDCFSQPLLPTDADRKTAAKIVLHTDRAGADPALSTAGEPDPPTLAGTYNMADVVRGSLLIDNVFPAYRGFVFALVRKPGNAGEEAVIGQRQVAEHFTQVYSNKSMICLNCHRSEFSCSEAKFTPGYSWAKKQEGRVFSALEPWTSPPADADWIESFRYTSGSIVPFAGWSKMACGGFTTDTSAAATNGSGLLLPPEDNATVWSLDDRLKEGYLALRESYKTGALDTGSGFANEGRTLGAYWLAAAFANDIWREIFGAPLTIANFVSRNPDEQKMLWNLAEHHVVGRDWSLKGLLTEIVTSPYFNRTPASVENMPKVFEPFIAAPASDYVGDAVHRRSADLLFRMKASALGWNLPVSHFPSATTYPTRSDAAAMGLHLSRLSVASPTSSQFSLLGWEASGGRCERPPAITRDWIDALSDRARTGGVTVRGAVEALRFRLLGRGLSTGAAEATALATFLGKSLTTTFTTAYPTASQGNAALRDLCEVFVKTPQFMLEGVPHGLGAAATDFDSPPQLQVGDMGPGGALVTDTPSDACESWLDQTNTFDGISVNCANESFPAAVDWSVICPKGGCIYIDKIRFRPPWPWPCLTCAFPGDWYTTRPPPIDPRTAHVRSIPMQPARGGVFLAWAKDAQIVQVSGQARIVRASSQTETALVGKSLGVGDSLELWPGDTFQVVTPGGEVFKSPTGGMPNIPNQTTWLFMVTGPEGLPDPVEMTPTTVDLPTAMDVSKAMRDAARNEEPGSVSLIHEVTSPSGNSSFIDHPELNGKPNRIVLVSPLQGTNTTNNHFVGAWYSASLQKWAVYNEDLVAMPAGARFAVRAMSPSNSVFVHQVAAGNAGGNFTYIDHPSLNGNPYVAPQVSHIYNPQGAPGVYNNHPVGVYYNVGIQRWGIYNEDLAALPMGASFAVKLGGYHTVVSSAATRSGSALVIDDPNTNGVPDARLFFTHVNRSPDGVIKYHTKRSVLRYNTTLAKWTIVNLDGTTVADDLAFNVHRGY